MHKNLRGFAPLVIYAYTSFTAPWGVGPKLVKQFEDKCRCKVEMVDAGDGGAMVARLKLERERARADLVVGFDETLLSKVRSELGWTEFTAIDKGPYAFVYNSDDVKNPPTSFDDLLKPEWKRQVVIEDPRVSTTGLGLLLWVIKEKGDGAWSFLEKFKSQVKVVAPSWDLAYGMFKKNQAKLVFSYWTSPAYHIQEEHKHGIRAAEFRSGHYVQTEYMAINPETKDKQLAAQFVQFMLSAPAQAEIPKKNFMYPVNPKALLTPAFKEIKSPKTIDSLSARELEHLDEWLKRWRDIFTQ